jgi:radical SAM superfamily enzyme YgiQ (UPF0313 family)
MRRFAVRLFLSARHDHPASTLNARYAHASLGLRYLLANMGECRSRRALMEFVIGAKTTEVVERLLAQQPRIVGFGVYIWNVEETTKVVAMLKRVAPEVTVVLGGPEVSYETNEQEIVKLADYVVTGWGDVTFPKLCGEILHGPKPLMKSPRRRAAADGRDRPALLSI